MEAFHVMLPEDEIFLCGMVLLYGFLIGGRDPADRRLAGKEVGMILFAHHVEPQHVPVLAVFFGVGIWLGWRAMSALCKRPRETASSPSE